MVCDISAELCAGEVDGIACFECEIPGLFEVVGECGYGEDATFACDELPFIVDSSSGVEDFY